MKLVRPLLVAVLLAVTPLFADPRPSSAVTDPAAKLAALRKIADGLHYQVGKITLHDGLASVALNDKFRYLSPLDAETVLVKIWGNPKGEEPLGMLVPADFDPLADASWAVIITFAEDGYVKDDEASKINYIELLQQMQDGTKEASKQRVEAGYAPIELVGWASPPRYDATTHKLYWAKEIKFGSDREHTLNYNIRMLGRRGVLVLNAVAAMHQLASVEAATPTILSMVDFQESHRYTDFNNDTDKVATYGIAALVAGGIAAKAGFFKVIWLGILAFKKLIIIAVIALAGYAKKLWTWIRGRQVAPTEQGSNSSSGTPNS